MARSVPAVAGTPAGAAEALTRGPLRWARGSTVGLVATGLALAGHVVGGGATPPPLPMVGLATLALGTGVALSNRRWSLTPLLAVLLAMQGAFHVAFGDLTSSTTTVVRPTHQHATAAAMAAHHAGWRMLVAHLIAVVAVALLLRHGERWCWHLVTLICTRVRAFRLVGGAPPVPPAPPSVRAGHTPRLRTTLLHALCPSRRGPPCAAAV